MVIIRVILSQNPHHIQCLSDYIIIHEISIVIAPWPEQDLGHMIATLEPAIVS